MKIRLCAIMLLIGVFLSCFWGCGNDSQGDWSSGVMQGQQPAQHQTQDPGDNNDATTENNEEPEVKPEQETEDTQPEDVTTPTREPVEVVQRMDSSYEKFLAAGVLLGLSMQYPDFQLEELCFKEEHDFEDKMESGGVYAFFQSGGESLCIHAKPLAETRTEKGTCDLQETTLGYATFDLVNVRVSDLTGYISVMDEDLTEQINQLYLLTIMEN